MPHAGQSSRAERLARIEQEKAIKFRGLVDDLIWDQEVRSRDPSPAWVRPVILIGGLAVSLAWLGAVAHGCGS